MGGNKKRSELSSETSKSRIIFEIIKNFDEGIVITASKTGLAWTILIYFITWSYLKFHNNPDALGKSIKDTLQLWPLLVVIMSVGVSFMINIFEDSKMVIRGVKFLSGFIALVGSIIIMASVSPILGIYGLLLLLVLPFLKQYFQSRKKT